MQVPGVRRLSAVRPFTNSNDFSSEDIRPIIFIFHIKHQKVGDRLIVFFLSGLI